MITASQLAILPYNRVVADRAGLDALMAAKRRTVKAPDAYTLRLKLLRFATGRGFEAHLAADAADRLLGAE